MKVRLTFTEAVLGTWPSDPEIASNFLASKAPKKELEEQELINCDSFDEKGKTIFPKNDDGVPILYDYQIKGFFKDACSMLSRIKGTKSSGLKAYKKVIDGVLFVFPREIPIMGEYDIGSCQRPLRAQTAQGERISLANSEEIPAGAYIEIEILDALGNEPDKDQTALLTEWFNYGKMRGIGQWRNSGKGRYEWQLL